MKQTLKSVFAFAVLALPLSAAAEKNPKLPPPFETPSVENLSQVIGWPAGKTPTPAPGFRVELLASLDTPRSMLVLPSGNVLVTQAKKVTDASPLPSPNKITLLKLKEGKLAEAIPFIEGLNRPFGMVIWKNQFFVAEPDRVLVFDYDEMNEKILSAGKQIATLPFPKPQRHWTRHLLLKPDGGKLYVSVGSASNVGESGDPLDPSTAAILEMNLDGSGKRIFAFGIRNPVSIAWEPTTQKLWAAVNERDELGDNLVPDYISHIVDGGFYGWPYSYWGQNVDPRQKGKGADLVARAITPDFSVGSHVAALGLEFTHGKKIALPFSEGALVSLHGSWNRSHLAGYKVIYVPFVNGEPQELVLDFLTGFIADNAGNKVYGRPVAAAVLPDGSVLVTDDGAGKIWRVSPLL